MMEISELVKEHKLTDKHGNTVLHLAMKNKKFTQKGMIDVLKLLLDSGADPNTKNKNNETILQLAVKNRKKDVIDFLLKRVRDIDSSVYYFIEDEYKRFLKLSTKENSDQMDREIRDIEIESANFVEWLISKGFDFDCKNKKNQSPLVMAIKRNLQHILPVLLKFTKDIHFLDEANRSLLQMFFEEKAETRFSNRTNIDKNWYSNRYAVDIVKILLDRGEQSTNINQKNSEGETLFYMVIKNWVNSRDMEKDYFMAIAQTLIAKGVEIDEPDTFGMSPLGHVIERHIVSIAPTQKDYEAHLNAMARYALATQGYLDETNVNCSEPLSPKAIDKSNIGIVEFLDENGADFSTRTKDGETLLHLFFKSSDRINTNDDEEVKLFKLLIHKGCQVNAKDNTGTTPFHHAAMHSNIEFVKMLIELGALINCRNNDMETPLHFSTENPNIAEVAKYLLRLGANVNVKNSKGQTPLHKIASERRTKYSCDGLRMLLQYGADVNIRDLENHTALSCARSRDLDDWQRKREIWACRKNDAVSWARDHARDLSGWCTSSDEERPPPYVYTIDDCPFKDMASDVVMTLTAHSMKLKIVDLPWDMEINGYLGDFHETCSTEDLLETYNNKYEIEVEKLKSTFIDKRMTLYHFLHVNTNGRRIYIDNDNLQQLMYSPEFDVQFPNYAILILASYFDALNRRYLLEPAREANWLKLTKISMPASCLDLIFSFLSNSELFDIIEKE